MQLKSRGSSECWVHVFCFSEAFLEGQICRKEKKQLVQDLIPPPTICIHTRVLYTHVQINVSCNWVHLDSSGSSSVSSRPLGSMSVSHVQCVCLDAYTHTNTHLLWVQPLSRIEHIQMTPVYHSVKKQSSMPATGALHRQAEPNNHCPPMLMNIQRIHERMCTPWGDSI